MSNVSFARIMYGANQDSRPPAASDASASWSHYRTSIGEATKSAGLAGHLEELLRKAWLALRAKS